MRTVLKPNGFLLVVGLLLLATSCKESNQPDILPKPPENTLPLESVEYTDLTGKEIKRGDALRLDLNKDGIRDFSFGTQLVGDPLMGVDKVQYCVLSGEESYLPINEEETMARFNKGEVIPLEDFGGFFWNRISFNVLVQKIISETKPPYWEGNWKASHHHFFARTGL
jgi:hypothetical protein